LFCKNNTDDEGGQGNNRKRVDANRVTLPDDLIEFKWNPEGFPEDPNDEKGNTVHAYKKRTDAFGNVGFFLVPC
jgi:hypothetical protein